MGIYYVQDRLKAAGYYRDRVDGIAGKNTWSAIERALDDHLPKPKVVIKPPGKTVYPRQRDMRSFYGRPGGPQCTRGKVHLEVPMVIAWDTGKQIRRFSCHEKLVVPMTAIIKETVAHYGEDEWRRLRLDRYGGCYNFRKMRGGRSLSTHAFGAAIDLDPDHNRLRWGRDKAAFARSEYDAFWRIVKAHGGYSLGLSQNRDYMHIQWCSP